MSARMRACPCQYERSLKGGFQPDAAHGVLRVRLCVRLSVLSWVFPILSPPNKQGPKQGPPWEPPVHEEAHYRNSESIGSAFFWEKHNF